MSSEKIVTFKSTTAVRTLAVVLAKLRHEFRTQLNAIIGSGELLLEDCQTSGFQPLIPELRKIHLTGQHMLKLVNKLLDPDELDARASDQALKECAAQASEALRSPLNSVININDTLLKEADNLGQTDLIGDLQNIRVAAGKLVSLLDRLASFNAAGNAVGGSDEVSRQSSPTRTSALPAQKIGMTEALTPMSKEEIEIAAAECGHLLVVDSNDLDRDLL